jgi:hypothetical protein
MACSLVKKKIKYKYVMERKYNSLVPYDSGVTEFTFAREQPYQLYVTKETLNSEHGKGMIVCT